MKQLNTIPIEDFLEKARIAVKSNQKNLTLTIKEVASLQESLGVVMTRLTGKLDQYMHQDSKKEEVIQVKMDGGKF
jgi:hypothetical protein